MLYFVCVILYNHFALKRRGFDQVPNYNIPLPNAASRAINAIDEFFSSLRARLFPSARTGLNPSSHHWESDTGVGGSRFGSGARRDDEEEAMLAEENAEGPNPWNAEAAHPGMDSDGVIRL